MTGLLPNQTRPLLPPEMTEGLLSRYLRQKTDSLMAHPLSAPLEGTPAAGAHTPFTPGSLANTALEVMPGTGDAVALFDARRAWEEGKQAIAALHAATALPLVGDMAAMGKMASLPLMGAMTAFHGTPHRFPPTPRNELGEFDLSRIGTGEGAQAYGHGIYLAERPGVAKSYQASLARPIVEPTGYRNIDVTLETVYGGDWDKFKRAHADENPGSALSKAIADIESRGGPIVTRPGTLYEVDLPDDQIEKMLDWDAPVEWESGFGQEIVSAADDAGLDVDDLRDVMGAPGSGYEGQAETGRSVYEWLSASLGGDQQASKFLTEELGIPGIKYYDGGSRAAGEGTRNFVVFDPSIARIIGRK